MFSSANTKILIADDSAVYRKLIESVLSDPSCDLLFAENGQQALKLFTEYRPALVLTDWAMPDISGVELCRRIRSEVLDFRPYLILLTGNSEKQFVVEGLESGADDYVTKPFHCGELQARIRVGLRFAALCREIEVKNRQLEQMALSDHLTGLPNRRALERWADAQFSAAGRHKYPLWIVIADLDQFKGINDRFGHLAGDEVIRRFGEILKASTRRSNMCSRIGGEEFLIILTHLEQGGVKTAVERIRQQFAEQEFTKQGTTFRATVSFGAAGFDGKTNCSLDELIRRADAALYAAKKKGRNRLEFAP